MNEILEFLVKVGYNDDRKTEFSQRIFRFRQALLSAGYSSNEVSEITKAMFSRPCSSQT